MSETGLKIRVFGDPVLKQKAAVLKQVTASHRRLLSEMAQLMYDAKGVGLAAPQVGVSERLIVVDIGEGLYKLVNPKITKRKGSFAIEEGCLSVPGVGVKVRRAKNITLSAEDENAKPLKIQAEGLLACVFQHEIDHLNGRLIIDYSSLLQRMRLKKALAAIKEKAKDEKLRQPEGEPGELQL